MDIVIGKGQDDAIEKAYQEAAIKADTLMRSGADSGKLAALPYLLTLARGGKSVREAVAYLPPVPDKDGKLVPRKSSGAWQETYKTVNGLLTVGTKAPASIVSDIQTRLKGEGDGAITSFAELTRTVNDTMAKLVADGTIKVRQSTRQEKKMEERAVGRVDSLLKLAAKWEKEGVKATGDNAKPIRRFNAMDILRAKLNGQSFRVVFMEDKPAEGTADVTTEKPVVRAA